MPNKLIRSLIADAYYLLLDCLTPELALKITGYRKLGYWIDIKTPKTFNEKINWRKLYQRDPRFDVLSDKQDVKDYITKKVGIEHVVPTLWCGANFDEIPWETFTYPIVIKCTHSTGDALFIHSFSEVKTEKIRAHFSGFWDTRKLKRYSRTTHGSKNKRYIIEPLLGSGGQVPSDYKCHCFHGKVHYIQVDDDRFGNHVRRFYDRDWNPLNILLSFGSKITPLGQIKFRPKEYEDLLFIADTLSDDFDHVRVDLYLVNGRIYCGELTFAHNAGYAAFTPESWDITFGNLWKLG